MKYLALLLLIAGCSCLAVPPPEAVSAHSSESANIETIRSATIALLQEDEGSLYISCSGVWIGYRTILTAAHCVEGADEHAYATYETVGHGPRDDEQDPDGYAEVFNVDVTHDLALLVVAGEPEQHPIATLAPGEALAGERVHIVGHTMGLAYSYSPGWASGVRYNMRGPKPIRGDFLQVFCGAYMGNSGGGVWDEAGRLLGITSFVRTDVPITFFVSRGTVARFISG